MTLVGLRSEVETMFPTGTYENRNPVAELIIVLTLWGEVSQVGVFNGRMNLFTSNMSQTCEKKYDLFFTKFKNMMGGGGETC